MTKTCYFLDMLRSCAITCRVMKNEVQSSTGTSHSVFDAFSGCSFILTKKKTDCGAISTTLEKLDGAVSEAHQQTLGLAGRMAWEQHQMSHPPSLPSGAKHFPYTALPVPVRFLLTSRALGSIAGMESSWICIFWKTRNAVRIDSFSWG